MKNTFAFLLTRNLRGEITEAMGTDAYYKPDGRLSYANKIHEVIKYAEGLKNVRADIVGVRMCKGNISRHTRIGDFDLNGNTILYYGERK